GQRPTASEYATKYGITTDAWKEEDRNRNTSHSMSAFVAGPSRTMTERNRSVALLDDVQIAQSLPGFRILSELGRGAFSRVFLARQLDLANRLVVLKVSTESFAEADKMAQLQHAHIVPIYSVHRAGKLFAVCMPYFGATTLADLVGKLGDSHLLPLTGRIVADTVTNRTASTRILKGQPGPVSIAMEQVRVVPGTGTSESIVAGAPDAMAFLKTLGALTYVEAVLSIGERLADGLSHAHERGIIHRDLKPANVLLADDGRPMLLDFNLSEDLKPDSTNSDPVVGGTLPYMAPEQLVAFQQRQSSRDPRSDIYSLGAILYELLTGRQPFPTRQGELERILAAMVEDRRQVPVRLRKINPAASPAVEAIVHRCLEIDPRKRYQLAAELREDLKRQLQHLPLRYTREPSLRERALKWTRRHPRLTSVATIAALTTGLALSVGTYVEHKRIAALQHEVSVLMRDGKDAMDHAEADVAQGRFLAAWMMVQSEPAMLDHLPGVAGWLDHSRRAVIQQQWKQRIPPREFDEQRDEAILLSLLLDPAAPEPVAAARDAISAALKMTIAGDPGWAVEREQLLHVEADLIAATSGARQALTLFDQTDEFSSRQFLEHRAELLQQLGRTTEALALQQRAAQLPPNEAANTFLTGINRLRRREFKLARQNFEHLLDTQPEHFAARLLQGVCYLHEKLPNEAKIALTACIAQRPYCMWSYYFRSQARIALNDPKGATSDLQRSLELRPPESVRLAVLTQLNTLQGPLTTRSTK
ncbi:MAG: tetratricopeptide repeat protein, partial [Planctomycetaceae bacterium]|nr:tetratricopeptide repeat protein [Planctomycetaceae bacterium]